jgi:hypothetical protein
VTRRELEAPCHACGAPTGADRALCAACAASVRKADHPQRARQTDAHGFMLWNSGWPWPEGWPRAGDGQAFDGRYRVLHVSLKGKVRLTHPSQADGPGVRAGNAGPVCSLAATHLRGLRRAGKTLWTARGCDTSGDCQNHGGA